ncbi:MAG: SemiSWEET transporter [Thermodesulfovibrionia bacterium]
MDINYIAIIGLIAGTCTTISFLPQVIKIIKTKETKDISISMYIILATGMLLWIIYGIFIEALPVILANTISFIFATIVLSLKIRYG